MAKIKIEKERQEFLIDLFETLSKNPQFDTEYYSLAAVVCKMYSYDIELATTWTIQLINQYGVHALRDYMNDFDYDAAVRDFINELVHDLIVHKGVDGTVRIIHDKIQLSEVRGFLWTYLFGPKREKNKFIIYFEELVQQKKYQDAENMVKLVMANSHLIPYEIFDATYFLNRLVEHFTCRKEKIKDQELLDLLYSFVNLIPTEFGKAVVKSNFVDYI